MGDRFGSFLDESKLADLNKLIGEIAAAIDAGELEKADRLRASFRKFMPSRGGQGGGGERRGRGGE